MDAYFKAMFLPATEDRQNLVSDPPVVLVQCLFHVSSILLQVSSGMFLPSSTQLLSWFFIHD